MSLSSRGKSRETAAYLKKMGVERKTGMCPWGCGASIANGGGPLISHLTRCHGNPRKIGRVTRVGNYTHSSSTVRTGAGESALRQ